MHWAEVQKHSTQGGSKADELLTKYVLEGGRLSNSLGIFRNVEPCDGPTVDIVQKGQTITEERRQSLCQLRMSRLCPSTKHELTWATLLDHRLPGRRSIS